MSNPTFNGNPVKYVVPLATDAQGNPTGPTNGSNGGGSGQVEVTNFPTWSGVGNILVGTVAQGEEKLIEVSGATAIWIQASPDNTEPLLVSNVSGFEGAWVMPGSSEWFYYPTLYVKHNATETQGIAYQGVAYG